MELKTLNKYNILRIIVIVGFYPVLGKGYFVYYIKEGKASSEGAEFIRQKRYSSSTGRLILYSAFFASS